MKNKNAFSKHALGLIGMLSLQFLLGMFANLFIEFPEKASEKQLWAFTWTQIPLDLHIIIGLGLLIGAVVLFIKAIRQKNRQWLIASSIGGVAIVVADYTGASFISSQSDSYSFAMAVSFIVALLAYGWGVYKENELSK
ncbi:MAG: hypothetical protein ACREHC_03570 [Candidatus Levyibacteriota bacterium]